MGCGQRTSEELNTLHSSLDPINLTLPPQWSSCLAATAFSLLHFHFIPLTPPYGLHKRHPVKIWVFSRSFTLMTFWSVKAAAAAATRKKGNQTTFWLPLFSSSWFHLIKSQRQLSKTTPLWNTKCVQNDDEPVLSNFQPCSHDFSSCEAQSYLMLPF